MFGNKIGELSFGKVIQKSIQLLALDPHSCVLFLCLVLFCSSVYVRMYVSVIMMMIAFMTINSGLTPLIEGLCAQIFTLDLRLSVVCVHIFCFSFSEGKT